MEANSTVTIAIIVALAPIFTALGALVGSWYATRTSAKQSELNALRDRVDELTRENIVLHRYVSRLQLVLISAGLPVPDMPESVFQKEVQQV